LSVLALLPATPELSSNGHTQRHLSLLPATATWRKVWRWMTQMDQVQIVCAYHVCAHRFDVSNYAFQTTQSVDDVSNYAKV